MTYTVKAGYWDEEAKCEVQDYCEEITHLNAACGTAYTLSQRFFPEGHKYAYARIHTESLILVVKDLDSLCNYVLDTYMPERDS